MFLCANIVIQYTNIARIVAKPKPKPNPNPKPNLT